MRIRALLPLLLLVFTAFTPVQEAFAQGLDQPFHFKLHLYSPCKVRLDYEYTKNITVSDVTSLGPSLYEVTHSPIDFRFEASDVDTYSFTLELVYEVPTIQVLTLTVFSGSQPPSTLQIPVASKKVVIEFEVTVALEPKYPSVDEITEQVIQHLMGQLEIYHSENQQAYRLIQRGIANFSYLVALNIVGLIILGAVVYVNTRRSG